MAISQLSLLPPTGKQLCIVQDCFQLFSPQSRNALYCPTHNTPASKQARRRAAAKEAREAKKGDL